ncbi:MAG: hypothetical protein ACHP84_11585 [Caulobacterales bacterium]
MIRRLLLTLAAVTMFAVAAGVCVVALAFALYAFAKIYVGQPAAAGVVAGSAALFIALIGVILANAGKPPKRKPGSDEPVGFVDRVLDFVREKPVVSIVSALAAGLLAVRNPEYLGSAIRAFFEGRDPPRR